jgi:hypothetical protein
MSTAAFDPSKIVPNEAMGELLAGVPLLAKLTREERSKLGGVLVERKYQRGEPIIKQVRLCVLVRVCDMRVHSISCQISLFSLWAG